MCFSSRGFGRANLHAGLPLSGREWFTRFWHHAGRRASWRAQTPSKDRSFAREALAAATSNYSEVFGLQDRGLIEKGRRADIVILRADPRNELLGRTKN